ncbi:MAG: class I SAM-dependent methyltransferase [Phycisphaerales bacterium]
MGDADQSPHAPQGDAPTRRFTGRVGDYAKHRPSYPPEAIDALLEGIAPGAWAADIGAGTGISTRLLLDRGINVHAVEPNADMRRRGKADTASFGTRVLWHDSTGERTGLADAAVSLVLCAQSLHWLEGAAAMHEFARILSPGGRAAALWNVHDVRDPAMAAYRDVVMRHARDVPRSPWFRNDACVLGAPAARAAGLTGYRLREFPNQHTVTLEGLIGRAMSASYMPAEGPQRAAAESDLADLFVRFASGGSLVMRYVCELHIAERV